MTISLLSSVSNSHTLAHYNCFDHSISEVFQVTIYLHLLAMETRLLFLSFCLLLLMHPLPSRQLSDKELMKLLKKGSEYYMLLKAAKKKYIPVPIPVPILPILLMKAKKKMNEDAEFYWVKPDCAPTKQIIRKYVQTNGIQSLYY